MINCVHQECPNLKASEVKVVLVHEYTSEFNSILEVTELAIHLIIYRDQ
jgi:hypothetical protein